jgi:hypothetical protein
MAGRIDIVDIGVGRMAAEDTEDTGDTGADILVEDKDCRMTDTVDMIGLEDMVVDKCHCIRVDPVEEEREELEVEEDSLMGSYHSSTTKQQQ